MLRVFETFSGIGSQAKALANQGIDHEIVNTVDWDINAIYAYDIIHNGAQDITFLKDKSKEDMITLLSRYNLSMDGKKSMTSDSLSRLTVLTMKKIYAAIIRTKNLVNVQDVTAEHLPVDLDLLTYSFPCQDLSVSGFWHGNAGGIERNSNNRSSMLWEIERILFDLRDSGKSLPRFLLMENVTAIRSSRHIEHFEEWQSVLTEMGYQNQTYDLRADYFGVPQRRKRTFMISVFVGNENNDVREFVEQYFNENNLENQVLNEGPYGNLRDFLRIDYNNPIYLAEALTSIPNDTASRRRIHIDNPMILDNMNNTDLTSVRTITTKQDRHPNSGVIEHNLLEVEALGLIDKSPFRYLTPRECFLFMGFEERDFNRLIENNFNVRLNANFLTRDKLNKLAGNSIVVNVLEAIFQQIYDLRNQINQL